MCTLCRFTYDVDIVRGVHSAAVLPSKVYCVDIHLYTITCTQNSRNNSMNVIFFYVTTYSRVVSLLLYLTVNRELPGKV